MVFLLVAEWAALMVGLWDVVWAAASVAKWDSSSAASSVEWKAGRSVDLKAALSDASMVDSMVSLLV